MDKEVRWTHQADADLHNAFLNLLDQTESIELTTKVITEIYESSSILSTYAEIYKLDEFKKNNNGNVRSYEKHSYRISYLVEKQFVYIIRVRYAKKEPLKY